MSENDLEVVELVAGIVSAFVSHNSVIQADLPALIASTHAALAGLGQAPAPAPGEKAAPAVSIKKSITADWLICLEDGKKFRSLRRHLRTAFDMTPEQYRAKWNLPLDYPMVAPAYAETRSHLAKKMGLGRKVQATPEKRGRSKATA
ncbi:MucR family transcriptional regulator [Bosea sp. NBC_00550]|uniref:MucR family transcriptional regulator n=1 Tax=Bosea sp. NBC_00550 TaxID=2969621 RepID=UPI002230F91A|nr:MucR family transcriptional regulator [Bosea sp. NBC_00550]UZF95591.1 MucR family transcriptional regulator [Bosea sp. NBC_00550]